MLLRFACATPSPTPEREISYIFSNLNVDENENKIYRNVYKYHLILFEFNIRLSIFSVCFRCPALIVRLDRWMGLG